MITTAEKPAPDAPTKDPITIAEKPAASYVSKPSNAAIWIAVGLSVALVALLIYAIVNAI